MVSLEFHDPSGAIEVKQPHAPRIATLAGKRIGFVSNEQWQAYCSRRTSRASRCCRSTPSPGATR